MFEEYKNEQEIVDELMVGKITPTEFYCIYHNNVNIKRLLEKKLDNPNFFGAIFGKSCSNINEKENHWINENTTLRNVDIYNYVYNIEAFYNVDLVKFKKWDDEAKFIRNTIPDYLDGEQYLCNYIIENIISKLPTDLSYAKRVKLCKEEIKKAFYIEGNKYPHWIQSSEWPLSKTGKPTKYLRTENKHGGEVKAYIFLDVDTNEEIVVEQYY